MFVRSLNAALTAAVIAGPLALLPVTASAAPVIPVGLELMLLVDVSGSVNGTEYDLQKTGYVNAFNSPTVQTAIDGISGGIAVTYIEWSGAAEQSVLVGWTLITDATSASAFASALNATTRAYSGSTAPGSALNFGAPLFTDNGYDGARLVIDVSGDGSQNDGDNTVAARNAALAGSVTQDAVDVINGLPILGSEANLDTWYAANIQGGSGSFTLAASSFATFQTAIERKLVAEITGTGVPEPATVMVLGASLLGLGFARRRKG